MIRSRRSALVAVAIVLGLSACGDPNTTAPLADQPPVIRLASGQTGSAGGSSAAAPTAELDASAADTKMAFAAPTEFVYDGELPVLDGPAGSWFFGTGQQADVDRIASLAASLGVEGDVRSLPQDQGGGWAVGPEDYSDSVLFVGSDGMLSWYFNGPPSAMSRGGCVEAGIAVDPAVGSGVAGSSGTPTDAVAAPETLPADTPTDTKPAVEVLPPDACATPEPPVGVPTKDEALAKAQQLFADWGYDVNSYQFDEAYADEWSATINASLVLEGMKAPVMLSVGFGENGVVTYASGYLSEPERGADYPTIGTAAGLERLKEQQNQYFGFGDPAVLSASDTDVAVAPAVGAPAIAPCEPESARADCAPVDAEPVTVTLNSVKADLTMLWGADNTIWLLPAYSFGSTDGGIYTVIAVDDAYIQEAEPEIATTEPAVDPDVPVTAVAVDGGDVSACTKFETPTEITTPGLDVEWAQRWVGLCLSYAEEEAAVLGWSVRVVRQDGVDLDATDDFSDTRINVAVDGEIITEIISIG